MTTEQIENLFWETINKKEAYGEALYNKLEGISENNLYNWRKKRVKPPTIGDMLNVLYQLKLIKVIGIVEIPHEEILNSIKEKPLKLVEVLKTEVLDNERITPKILESGEYLYPNGTTSQEVKKLIKSK